MGGVRMVGWLRREYAGLHENIDGIELNWSDNNQSEWGDVFKRARIWEWIISSNNNRAIDWSKSLREWIYSYISTSLLIRSIYPTISISE